MSGVKKLRICGMSDVGKTRSENQDAFLIGNTVERTGLVSIELDMNSYALQEQGFLIAVADGMGGMSSGDLASTLGLNIISKTYYSRTYANAGKDEITESLKQAFSNAHQKLTETSRKKAELRNMGTTIVGLNIHNDRFYRYHAGDSRLYRFRDGELIQVSRDHSLVQMLVDSGKLNQEDADSFSRRHEITNSVGAGAACKPEIELMKKDDVKPGDLFLLCSDGLSNELDKPVTPKEFEALNQLLAQSAIKEKEFDKVIRELCSGDFYDRVTPVLEGIDSALQSGSTKKKLEQICKSIHQIHSNWQAWHQVLSIFLINIEHNPIAKILETSVCLEEKTRTLIKHANDRISKDNVTAVLVEAL